MSGAEISKQRQNVRLCDQGGDRSLTEGRLKGAANAVLCTAGCVDHFFKISERGSTIRTELMAGFVNFLANSYLVRNLACKAVSSLQSSLLFHNALTINSLLHWIRLLWYHR